MARPGYINGFLVRLKNAVDRIDALGYTWDVCDEAYIEANPAFLDHYTAVIVIEQAEYVTHELRSAFDT